MKRQTFLAAAAGAICVVQPLLAKAETPSSRAAVASTIGASGFPKPAWECGCAVVWLDVPSGVYYHKGDARYGLTNRGAYSCEAEAINAGNRVSA
jgi:hypothetical protein